MSKKTKKNIGAVDGSASVFLIIQSVILLLSILFLAGILTGSSAPEEGDSAIPIVLSVFASFFIFVPNIIIGLLIVISKTIKNKLTVAEFLLFAANVILYALPMFLMRFF